VSNIPIPIKIVRFSDDGFIPKEQTHHMKLHKNNSFAVENAEILKSGIWVFIDGFIKIGHLDCLKECKHAWIASILPNTLVVDAGWSKFIKISDNECKDYGVFIPENTIKAIKDIHKIF
jgi:hypothetical protein